jgi:hypothetical protein
MPLQPGCSAGGQDPADDEEEPKAALDQDKLMAFLGMLVGDLAATMAAGGGSSGTTRPLSGSVPESRQHRRPGRSDGDRRPVRRGTGARRGCRRHVQYDPASGEYSMTEEQAFAFTDPDGPASVPCAFQLVWLPCWRYRR